MATKKAAGATKNGRDSNPKYLGVKINDGGTAKIGQIILRQRGTVYLSGKGTALGSDHTVYAMKDGLVHYGEKRKGNFDGSTSRHKIISVE